MSYTITKENYTKKDKYDALSLKSLIVKFHEVGDEVFYK